MEEVKKIEDMKFARLERIERMKLIKKYPKEYKEMMKEVLRQLSPEYIKEQKELARIEWALQRGGKIFRDGKDITEEVRKEWKMKNLITN